MPTDEHPRPLVTVDLCVIRPAEAAEVLLVRRGHPPFEGRWAIPGGFVEMDEGLARAARRELAEETGVTGKGPLLEVGAFGEPGRDPRGRVISIAFVSVVPADTEATAGSDAAATAWHALTDLPPLAFDHAEILSRARDTLRTHLETGEVALPTGAREDLFRDL